MKAILLFAFSFFSTLAFSLPPGDYSLDASQPADSSGGTFSYNLCLSSTPGPNINNWKKNIWCSKDNVSGSDEINRMRANADIMFRFYKDRGIKVPTPTEKEGAKTYYNRLNDDFRTKVFPNVSKDKLWDEILNWKVAEDDCRDTLSAARAKAKGASRPEGGGPAQTAPRE